MRRYAKNRLKARLFHWIARLANGIASLPAKLTPPPFRLIQMGSAYWQSRLLHLVTELDIATHLHGGALSIGELAKSAAVNEDHLRRMLRYMATQGVFELRSGDTVGNTAASSFLDRHRPDNVRAMVLLHQSSPMADAWWKGLGEGVRQGKPGFALCHGEPLFDYLTHHNDFNRLFSEAMTSVETLIGSHYAQDFDWSAFQRIIDIGGSNGSKAAAILSKHPQITATVCDLPAVIAEVVKNPPPSIREDVAARISYLPGDAFGELPPAGPDDIYLLSALLHGFSDEQCIEILRNIRTRSGRCNPWLVIMEMVVEESIDAATAAFDMQMLVCTEGKERNLQEWRSIIQKGGYELVEHVATASLASLLLLRGNCESET